jgi:hypothetical protein
MRHQAAYRSGCGPKQLSPGHLSSRRLSFTNLSKTFYLGKAADQDWGDAASDPSDAEITSSTIPILCSSLSRRGSSWFHRASHMASETSSSRRRLRISSSLLSVVGAPFDIDCHDSAARRPCHGTAPTAGPPLARPAAGDFGTLPPTRQMRHTRLGNEAPSLPGILR